MQSAASFINCNTAPSFTHTSDNTGVLVRTSDWNAQCQSSSAELCSRRDISCIWSFLSFACKKKKNGDDSCFFLPIFFRYLHLLFIFLFCLERKIFACNLENVLYVA